MDANCYVIEHMIRDRLADARATAKFAAVLRQRDPRRPRSNSFGTRLVQFGGSLGTGARKAALDISRALRSWPDVTKRSNHATSDVRGRTS
jgi:hypothetical protein